MAISERILMKGNEALAEAAIQAGCKHFFGYPITPQTEINAYMSRRLPKVGGTYLQAESEIAAANMVLGAGAAGVRAMTSSSSPGISLKSEAISYLAGSDIPCVIINIQRGGPGLGGIQPSQADYYQATKAPGHGDFHVLVFAPCTVQEMVDTVFNAFDLAERYRMPALILGDGLLGQMMEPVEFPEREVTKHEKPWALTGTKGERDPLIVTSLHLQAAALEKTIIERYERYAEIEENHSLCEEYLTDDADIVIVAYGAASRVAHSAVNTARENGLKVGLLRPITLWPFPKKQLNNISKKVKNILTLEMSMGQMVDDVRLTVEKDCEVSFFGRTGGIVPTPAEVLQQIEKITGGVR